MDNMMFTFLEQISTDVEVMTTIFIVGFCIALPFVLYVIFDSFCKNIAERVYDKLEQKKLQKEYDKLITAREERYALVKKELEKK